jgi:hypothetical protein
LGGLLLTVGLAGVCHRPAIRWRGRSNTFYFQSLPRLEESFSAVTTLWTVACITQKRKEKAMKTKTDVKAGVIIRN